MKTWRRALDLHNDPELIEKYKWHHHRDGILPKIVDNILGQGILSERIFCAGNRLFMVLETTDDFSFEAKAAIDAANPRMQEWERLMWNFQKPLPQAKPGGKWVLMGKSFELER